MAAIDHSVIVFKNGERMKETWKYDDDGEYVSLLPFNYTRDGNILSYEANYHSVILYHLLKWRVDEYNALYRRAGIKRLYNSVTTHTIWNRIKWLLRFKERNYGAEYTHKIGVYEDEEDRVRIYIYHDMVRQSYVSFILYGDDYYVVLGGYGHHGNVYTHFIDRGYDDEFEDKMTREALRWCVSDPLLEISNTLNDDYCECEKWHKTYKELFLKRKD